MSKVHLEKIKNWALVILGILTLCGAGFSYAALMNLENEQSKLTAQDAQVQRLNTKLGISESSLLTEHELNKKYKSDIGKFPKKLQEAIDEYDLRIQSRDKTIAALRNTITGGKTSVEIGGRRPPDAIPLPPVLANAEPGSEDEQCGIWLTKQVLKYKWSEKNGRFTLEDPDIFVKNDETFTSEQYLIVVGHVLYGKDGNLQIKRVELKEVRLVGVDNKGKPQYEPVEGSEIQLVDSKFEYTNTLPVKEKSIFDVITLRPIFTFDTSITPGIGLELLNTGRFIDWLNIGIAPRISLDLSDPLGGSLQNSRLDLGVHYQLLPPLLNTNFAIGVSVGTPFNHFGAFDKLVFTLDVTLFLTDDLTFWKND